jgi:hypothetical protein
VLTLGLIPNFTCAELGYDLTLTGAALSGPVRVDTRERVSLLAGWMAPVLVLFPSWSASFPREQEVAALRAALQRELAPILVHE